MRRAIRGMMLVALAALAFRALAQVPSAPASQPALVPPGPRPLPQMPQGGKVAVIQIKDTIDLGLAPFVERVLDSLSKSDVLVLDINTHGGRVDAAVVIRDALLHADPATVCWVNPRAISAGALISLACDVIAVAPGASIGAATPIELGGDGKARPVEEKVVSYMRAEMRATAEAKGRSGDIAEAMVDADREVPGLDPKGKLLTLDGTQALAWGIAELSAEDEPALFAGLGIAPQVVERPRISWAERVARFLSDPMISGLLMTLGMLGILLELYSPGHGVALTAGLICLAVFFFGHHVVRLAGWEEILLFIVGVVLLGVEVFVPGHILPGVAGALCVVIALILALVNLDHVPITVAWSSGFLPRAIATVMGSIMATALAGWGMAKILPHTALGRPLVLQSVISGRVNLPTDELSGHVGRQAVAQSALRPSGKVLLDGQRIEAVMEHGFADVGARLRVVRAEHKRLIVRPEKPEETT